MFPITTDIQEFTFYGHHRFRGVMSNLKVYKLGFCNGVLLNDSLEYLEKGNRKQVYCKTFHSVDQIDTDLIQSYIFEAVDVDEAILLKKIIQ